MTTAPPPCPSCRHDNRAGARFCEACGTALELACTACGTLLRTGARFCDACGANTAGEAPHQATRSAPTPGAYTPRHLVERILRSHATLVGERKEVTVLFVDVQGSLALAARLGDERWHLLLDRFFTLLSDGVHRFEGTVNQYTGDGIMALFGAPLAHEDHVQRACHAALHLREALLELTQSVRDSEGVELAVRMGLNSGEVVVGAIGDDLRMDYTAQGHTVGLAQRIEQATRPGQVGVSAQVVRRAAGYFEFASRGTVVVAGESAPLELFELRDARQTQSRLAVSGARGFGPFVGRSGETHTLELALEHARDGHGQVVGVVGEPGIGKSRLCAEFVARCRDEGYAVYRAHCLAHAGNLPFTPVLELLRALFGVRVEDPPERVRGRIVEGLAGLAPHAREAVPILFDFMGVAAADDDVPSLDVHTRRQRLFGLLRALFEARAERGEVAVLLFDDVHWIDAASDGFLAELVTVVADSGSALLLLNFRPEYRAAWMRRSCYQQLALVPLALRAVRDLVGEMLGRADDVAELAERIAGWSGGNPFFAEEIVRELVERGALAGERGHYRMLQSAAGLPVPANVRALLSARIDRLPGSAKELLQLAAVSGRVLDREVIAAALAQLGGATVGIDDDLQRLTDAEFLITEGAGAGPGLAFKHPLTQEVALASLLGERRARLHGALAEALIARRGDRLDENAALIAAHHEAAGAPWPAAVWHRRAAEWAGLKDLSAALAHWQRGIAQIDALPAGTERDGYIAHASARALAYGWRLGRDAADWQTLFERGTRAARACADGANQVRLHAANSIARALNDDVVADYVIHGRLATELADELDDRGLACGARACLVLGYGYTGATVAAVQVADELIALAQGDYDLGNDVSGFSPLLTGSFARERLLGFARDVDTALARLPRIHQEALDHGYPEQALWTLYAEADLRFHAARRHGAGTLAEAARWLAGRLGVGNQLMAGLAIGAALACERDWQGTEAACAEALDLIERSGALRPVQAQYRALRGAALLELGDPARAVEEAARGVAYMRTSGCYINPYAYAVLARARLVRGEPAAAVAPLLDEYLALLERCGFRLLEGEAHELRASVARATGDLPLAVRHAACAVTSYRHFGLQGDAERLDEWAAALQG